MVAEIVYSYVCACYGHRCPLNIMQICLIDTINSHILGLLISSEAKSDAHM